MEKTNNLKLNVWEKSDPILVGDFNEDNRKIDAAVGALTAGAVKVAVGSYVGNGDFDKGTTVNVGFPIKVSGSRKTDSVFAAQNTTAVPARHT